MDESANNIGIQNVAYMEQLLAGRGPHGPSFQPRSIFASSASVAVGQSDFESDSGTGSLSDRLHQLIRNHRVRGHIVAAVDPLGTKLPCPPELKLEFYSFSESELDLLVNCPTLHLGEPITIRELFERLRATYCRSIGVQFMHIDDLAVREWLQSRMESTQNRLTLSRNEQLRILTRLTDAVVFEEFLRTKFLGAKTFSLEGCETLLPLLDLAIENCDQPVAIGCDNSRGQVLQERFVVDSCVLHLGEKLGVLDRDRELSAKNKKRALLDGAVNAAGAAWT